MIAPVASSMELAFLCRYYDPAFIAGHSGSISSSSRANNEFALTSVFRWSPLRSLNLNADLSYILYPYSRYGVRNPSERWRTGLDADWNISSGHSLNMAAGYKFDSGKGVSRLKFRLSYVYNSPIGLSSATRLETAYPVRGNASFLVYEEIIYKHPSKKINCALRGTFFLVDDWDARIYCYERDVPQSFSVPAYYGRGVGVYAVATYKPASWLSISLKSSGTVFFDKSENTLRLSLYLNLLF